MTKKSVAGFGVIERRYASALADLAADSESLETVERDMNSLALMLDASPELQKMTGSPLFSRDQQEKAIMALATGARFHEITRNFLGVLARNRRILNLKGVLAAFRQEMRRRRGESEAQVRTAFALTPAQTKALQDQLSRAMGSHVTLNVEVDRNLLGGMVVTVGSRMIDDSVKGKLERLRIAMTQGSRAA